MRDKSRIEARLVSMGMGGILTQLLSGPLAEMINLPMASPSVAASVQRLLYGWLSFYPEVKAGLRMRLDPSTATLLIMPCGLPERRGRRPIY